MKRNLIIVLLLCAASLPAQTPPVLDPVPGHPFLHYGPPHWVCDSRGDCQQVQNWLDENNRQVLSPLGCFLARARITWIFGDRPSMCEKKPQKVKTP